MAKKGIAHKDKTVQDRDKQEEVKEHESNAPQLEASQEAQKTEPPPLEETSKAEEPSLTITSTQSKKNSSCGSKRSVCAMQKVILKKAQGKKFKVRCNGIGIPVGDTRHTLQSYIGMLARTMVPIDIPSWPKVATELKQKIWNDIEDTFKVPPELEKTCLQSAGVKWRQFKTKLTTEYVMPYIGKRKKLYKPPKKYAFVGKEAWRRFVAERTTKKWKKINKKQSEIVRKRKYPHRLSRKGYIGLEEEEVKAGRLKPGKKPNRAIFWKKARTPKDPAAVIDKDLAKKFKKIDSLLEMQEKGEFKPSGDSDVLSAVLETPEHSGRVRGVGSFVTPTTYFNLPRGGKNRISKDELIARDKKREEEFEKRTEEFDKKTETLMSQIAELRALIGASNLQLSSKFSEGDSCRAEKRMADDLIVEPVAAEELMENEGANDCVVVDTIDPPPPPNEKGPRKCELSVDKIDNKVAFGVVFDDEDMASTVHGVPLKPEHARVSVDGIIQGGAQVPVPIHGEIETVEQAVGSLLAWPRDLITYAPKGPTPVERKRKVKEPAKKGELQIAQDLFGKVLLSDNVPERYRLLYKYASCFMKATGASIQIPCDFDVFGIERTIFLLSENIVSLSEYKMLGQAVISTYMAFLWTTMQVHDRKSLDMYAFVDPSRYKFNAEFETYIISRLNDGVLHFMPFNQNMHWMLVVIWESEIFFLNPLSHATRFPELENALTGAVRSYNAQKGRVIKNPKIINLAGCPKQPGGIECGYCVMRYMKDIIEDKEMNFFKLWASKNRKSYTRKDLDVVRMETLGYIEGFM